MPQIVVEYVKKLDGIYGDSDALAATREKMFKFLGMLIDFRIPGT